MVQFQNHLQSLCVTMQHNLQLRVDKQRITVMLNVKLSQYIV